MVEELRRLYDRPDDQSIEEWAQMAEQTIDSYNTKLTGNVLLTLDQAKRLYEYLESTTDDGPRYSGWKSDKLKQDLNDLGEMIVKAGGEALRASYGYKW